MPLFSTLLTLARPRTLPLAAAAIICGNALAWHGNPAAWRFSVFALSLLTALALQIVSNIANDYGDGLRGTDRCRAPEAPQRLTAERRVHPARVRHILAGAILATLLLGSTLLAVSLHSPREWFAFLLLGALATAAALGYTLGRYAYGYHGLGEISVFLFFGLLGVQGSAYLQQSACPGAGWLPAAGCGLLAAGVLHINNIRDIESDRLSGKHTPAARLGFSRSQTLHSLLLAAALACYAAYPVSSPAGLVWLAALPLAAAHLRRLYTSATPAAAGRELAPIVRLTFIVNLLFGAGLLLDSLIPA
ncbi:1,4-dihydroxy-2-naphthoate octaprenyltransferase [Eikenella sp. S3360]|uniref:1,4-dihydroxy-2-naphthoate octaprenyltransferase n=1 Tax=Eikenella glucosivorans TaxID=2766967 RepID=A0ABS0N8V0_9NEIS|nr:1,4-dihydroxy-2-naphthoate octaprenyltransferase [Eikenella glucosivorans]MBH5328725.1 1,4-dihydroxy-2-naphthoate octaprenyltransferase [Eikenella glucosivorans]